ncbi:MAG: tape measure protein [Candidatus Obscuribacterales bacterium]|nr:tape measure protein [Candidatus Obscuribacterales bacterium]
MIVRELVTRLGFAVNDSQLTKYQRGTENIKRSAEGAAESFRNMFVAFAGFSLLRGISNTADEMQNLEARLAGLPQTVGDVGEAFGEVVRRANAARQPLKENASLYTRIGHATKQYVGEQKDVLDITDTISKGLIVGGASAQESASVMLQLAQALGSGVLQGQEFNAMAQGSPQLLDALAEAMGHPRDQLKKLASEGKITTKSLILAFQQIGPEVARQFTNMPITIEQALTIVNNKYSSFIARLNRESGAVTKIANFFIGAFNGIEAALEKMVDFFGGATQTLKFFAIAITALVIPALVKLGIGFVALLASPAGILMGILILLLLVIEDIYQWVTGGVSIFGEWAGSFDELIEKVKKFTVTLEILKWMGISMATLLTLHFAELAARSIISFAIMAAGWVASFAAMIISALPVVLIVLAIVAAVALLLAGIYYLWDNWEKIWQGMKDIAASVWKGLVSGFMSAIDKIKSAWNGFKSFFGMGVSTTVSATQAAGAASAPSGVPTAGGSSNVTINQTLPAGSPEATKVAAREGTTQALIANPWDKTARQMAQAQ